jgi:hypothetical protein
MGARTKGKMQNQVGAAFESIVLIDDASIDSKTIIGCIRLALTTV